jgi:hypothetical protein
MHVDADLRVCINFLASYRQKVFVATYCNTSLQKSINDFIVERQ